MRLSSEVGPLRVGSLVVVGWKAQLALLVVLANEKLEAEVVRCHGVVGRLLGRKGKWILEVTLMQELDLPS